MRIDIRRQVKSLKHIADYKKNSCYTLLLKNELEIKYVKLYIKNYEFVEINDMQYNFFQLMFYKCTAHHVTYSDKC